ncbi:mite allergen Lep d 7-like [Centruroides vittatus]|uniref:mite allergen Lep d 7-like n=1 Tax=Centruroides vittatus TaxID=120091 RepID=UPI00350F394C
MFNAIILSRFVFILILFSCGNCNDEVGGNSCDEFVDKVIESAILAYKHKIDPLYPKNLTFEFEKKILFITYRGEAKLSDTVVYGLSTIHREGDCELFAKDGVLKFAVTLGMGVLEFESKAKITFMKLGPKVTLSGEIGFALVHFEFSFDKNSGKLPSVDKVEIYDIKGSNVKVKGLGPLNHAADRIAASAIKLFRGRIRSKMEEKLREILDDEIKNHKFPTEE